MGKATRTLSKRLPPSKKTRRLPERHFRVCSRCGAAGWLLYCALAYLWMWKELGCRRLGARECRPKPPRFPRKACQEPSFALPRAPRDPCGSVQGRISMYLRRVAASREADRPLIYTPGAGSAFPSWRVRLTCRSARLPGAPSVRWTPRPGLAGAPHCAPRRSASPPARSPRPAPSAPPPLCVPTRAQLPFPFLRASPHPAPPGP